MTIWLLWFKGWPPESVKKQPFGHICIYYISWRLPDYEFCLRYSTECLRIFICRCLYPDLARSFTGKWKKIESAFSHRVVGPMGRRLRLCLPNEISVALISSGRWIQHLNRSKPCLNNYCRISKQGRAFRVELTSRSFQYGESLAYQGARSVGTFCTLVPPGPGSRQSWW